MGAAIIGDNHSMFLFDLYGLNKVLLLLVPGRLWHARPFVGRDNRSRKMFEFSVRVAVSCA